MVNISEVPSEVFFFIPLIIFSCVLIWMCSASSEDPAENDQQVPSSPEKKQKKPKSKKPKEPSEKKPAVQKKKNVHKIVPEGKAAYCKYCEVYMADDEQLANHAKGKKHQKNNARKDEKWFGITDNIETKDRVPPSTYIESKDDNLDEDEWVL